MTIPPEAGLPGATPALRLFSLLELMAGRDQLFSLPALGELTGLPKPTLHRMLVQLEGAGLLQRERDGRHYSTGLRMRRLAEQVMLNDSLHGARHVVLRQLVEEVGESCHLTVLSGCEVISLDHVETAAPLRFHLHSGLRVPAHCSASGKVFLAQMSAAQRRRTLAGAPLQRFTASTITDAEALEAELAGVRRDGYALDREEFLPGLLCVAVAVPGPDGRASLAVAVQAPALRFTAERALQVLPAMHRAAQALGRIDALAEPGGAAS